MESAAPFGPALDGYVAERTHGNWYRRRRGVGASEQGDEEQWLNREVKSLAHAYRSLGQDQGRAGPGPGADAPDVARCGGRERIACSRVPDGRRAHGVVFPASR